LQPIVIHGQHINEIWSSDRLYWASATANTSQVQMPVKSEVCPILLIKRKALGNTKVTVAQWLCNLVLMAQWLCNLMQPGDQGLIPQASSFSRAILQMNFGDQMWRSIVKNHVRKVYSHSVSQYLFDRFIWIMKNRVT
jgi:hypothetical protein